MQRQPARDTGGKQGGADLEILAHVKIGEAMWRQSCSEVGVNGACVKVERVRSGQATPVAG